MQNLSRGFEGKRRSRCDTIKRVTRTQITRKQSRRLPQRQLPPRSPTEPILCEAEVAEGLEELAASEIRQRFNKSARIEAVIRGAVSFYFTKDLRQLLDLRLAQATYTVCRFPIPRPKALLGDQNLRIVK